MSNSSGARTSNTSSSAGSPSSPQKKTRTTLSLKVLSPRRGKLLSPLRRSLSVLPQRRREKGRINSQKRSRRQWSEGSLAQGRKGGPSDRWRKALITRHTELLPRWSRSITSTWSARRKSLSCWLERVSKKSTSKTWRTSLRPGKQIAERTVFSSLFLT